GVGGLGREEASGAHAPDTAEGGLSHGDASLTPPRPVGEEMREPGQPTVCVSGSGAGLVLPVETGHYLGVV
ncbi:MAG TPA: hypothetical protein VF352_03895, partial [Anaerolineales bacterium]